MHCLTFLILSHIQGGLPLWLHLWDPSCFISGRVGSIRTLPRTSREERLECWLFSSHFTVKFLTGTKYPWNDPLSFSPRPLCNPNRAGTMFFLSLVPHDASVWALTSPSFLTSAKTSMSNLLFVSILNICDSFAYMYVCVTRTCSSYSGHKRDQIPQDWS